jgi:hypothetical protein
MAAASASKSAITFNMPAQPTPIAMRRPGCERGWIPCVLAAFAVLLSFCSLYTRAQEAAPSEYQIKAACLINFTKYVEWPEKAFAETNAPFVIAIYGVDNFGKDLPAMIQNKTMNGHPLEVKYFTNFFPTNTVCHLLFVSASEKQHASEILRQFNGNPVLTVGESDTFLAQSGIINFVLRDKKVRLQICIEAAEAANLSISSKMLSLAEIIKINPSK